MINIPALSEQDLGDTIEGEFGMLVSLKNPDGITIDTTIDGEPLKGFVRHSYTDTRERRGGSISNNIAVINAPCVRLRMSSLAEIPTTGKTWKIGIPVSPIEGAETEWYDLDPKRPVEVNKSRGTIKLFLARMQGSAA